jgi:glycosyltransferase involved in cell wall biosynthesis
MQAMDVKFYIVSVMFNAQDEVLEHIDMLKRQSYQNFHCVLVDDMSTDQSVSVATQAISGDSRFSLLVNNEKKYKVRNVVDALNSINPDDEDVVLIVDGDDRLAHESVLQTLLNVYQQKNALLTYGSHLNDRGERADMCQAYSDSVVRRNGFRRAKWHASHLKTFKYKLFKQIRFADLTITPQELKQTVKKTLFKGRLKSWLNWRHIKLQDLLEPSGQYIRRMDDKVLFFPMLEMAGDRAVFIEEILYVYRGQHVIDPNTKKRIKIIPGDHKNKWYGRLIREVLQSKPGYKRLDSGF